MQQTEIYKLNKPNFYTDMLSPDPLNENMEKVEAALTAARADASAGIAAEAAARQAADTAEAQARQTAVSAEAEARAAGDAAEAQTRAAGDTAEANTRAAADAALDARVQVLELRHFAAGAYTGTGSTSQFIELGFTPSAVIVPYTASNGAFNSNYLAISVTDYPHNLVKMQPGGFEVSSSANNSGTTYRYLAFC